MALAVGGGLLLRLLLLLLQALPEAGRVLPLALMAPVALPLEQGELLLLPLSALLLPLALPERLREELWQAEELPEPALLRELRELLLLLGLLDSEPCAPRAAPAPAPGLPLALSEARPLLLLPLREALPLTLGETLGLRL